ncbi:hypothetical protein PPYR_08477, partial [Photinus pyralis]
MNSEIVSIRGKEKFVCDGFIYIFDSISKSDENVKFWRCEERGRCKARIHTRDETVVKTLNIHSHDSSATKVEVGKTITRIKNVLLRQWNKQ